MFKNKSLLAWVLAAIAVIGTVVMALSFFTGGTAKAGKDSALVTTVTRAESIEASGVLEAQSSANLTWKTSGTVEKVQVKVGDTVRAGDILISLETTSAPANIISAQADLVSAEKALEDVLHSTLELAQAEQALANARQAVEDAREDVTKLDYRRASDDLLNQTQDEIDLANQKVSRAEDNYKRFKNRPDGDTLKAQAELNLINARTERDEKISMLNWYTEKPDDIEAAKYRAALSVAEAQLADAEREVTRLKDGPNAEDVAAARARVDAAQATVNALYIIAPFDGEVLAIEQNPGDVVSSGTPAISIANRSRLHIDAQVDEADIAQVAVGNPVNIKLDAMPGTTLVGSVTFINPLGESVSGLIKYSVRVELEPAEKPLLLGATTDLTIQVSDAQPALAVPASAVQSDSAGEYVMRIEPDGSSQRVAVQSSESIGELVIISGDLQDGDRIQTDYKNNMRIPNPLEKTR